MSKKNIEDQSISELPFYWVNHICLSLMSMTIYYGLLHNVMGYQPILIGAFLTGLLSHVTSNLLLQFVARGAIKMVPLIIVLVLTGLIING